MAHLSASPAAAAGHRVSSSPRTFSFLAQRKAVTSSIGAVWLRSWSQRAAPAALVRAAPNSNPRTEGAGLKKKKKGKKGAGSKVA